MTITRLNSTTPGIEKISGATSPRPQSGCNRPMPRARRWSMGPPLHFEPKCQIGCPGVSFRRVPIVTAEAEPVRPFLENMQIERHPCFAQRFGKLQAVFHWDRAIFFGVPNKTRRRLSGDLQFIR